MILPIVSYGHPSLRRKNEELQADDPRLPQLLDDMFETMYHSQGVGLAAPQVNLALRLFVVDGSPMQDIAEEGEDLSDFKKVFINPQKLEETGRPYPFEEGCLSIPDIREDVRRPDAITLSYLDRDFQPHTETFTGLKARIVQHEYDHVEGVLFTDHISPLRLRMLKGRLSKISKGQISVPYPMKFPKKR